MAESSVLHFENQNINSSFLLAALKVSTNKCSSNFFSFVPFPFLFPEALSRLGGARLSATPLFALCTCARVTEARDQTWEGVFKGCPAGRGALPAGVCRPAKVSRVEKKEWRSCVTY